MHIAGYHISKTEYMYLNVFSGHNSENLCYIFSLSVVCGCVYFHVYSCSDRQMQYF